MAECSTQQLRKPDDQLTDGGFEMHASPDLTMPILVVDDFGTMTRIIETLLRQVGFDNIALARDVASALDQLRSKRFELVIADWKMGPPGGLELLERMRGDPVTSSARFILMTA